MVSGPLPLGSHEVMSSLWVAFPVILIVPPHDATTTKPASTNAAAAALPMLEEAPVTSATGLAVAIVDSLYYWLMVVILRVTYTHCQEGGQQTFPAKESLMARYGKDHKHATRHRIIEAAGRRLKRDGIDGSGVATLMADAGLTNGAFYAHFGSKEDLVASTVADQLREQRERYSTQSLEEIVRGYLSPQHRDDTEGGCPSAALLDEIARSSDAVKRAYTDGQLAIIDDAAARLVPDDPQSARVPTLTVFALMVGTLQLSRALADRQLADDVLDQGIHNALALVGAEHQG